MAHVQPTLQDIYTPIRKTPRMLSDLMPTSDPQELEHRLSTIAQAGGRTDLTPQAMAAMIDDSFNALLNAAINADDLNDVELELAWAGFPVRSDGGLDNLN